MAKNPMKYDNGTIPLQLLPVLPMMETALVFGYGAEKYRKDSYRDQNYDAVEWSRTYGSVLRHLFKWNAGEDMDPDTGRSHLAHASAQLMILMEHVLTHNGEDDRFINKPEDRIWIYDLGEES